MSWHVFNQPRFCHYVYIVGFINYISGLFCNCRQWFKLKSQTAIILSIRSQGTIFYFFIYSFSYIISTLYKVLLSNTPVKIEGLEAMAQFTTFEFLCKTFIPVRSKFQHSRGLDRWSWTKHWTKQTLWDVKTRRLTF